MTLAVPAPLPQISIKVNELYNIDCIETCGEKRSLERSPCKMELFHDTTNNEMLLFSFLNHKITCRNLQFISASLWSVDLSVVSPSKPLRSAGVDNEEEEEATEGGNAEEHVLSKLFLLTSSNLTVFQPVLQLNSNSSTIHTKISRFPLSSSVYQKHLPQNSNNSHNMIYYNPRQSCLHIHKLNTRNPSIEYYENNLNDDDEHEGIDVNDSSKEKKHYFISSKNSFHEESVSLPKQLVYSMFSYESYASAVTFLQMNSLSSLNNKKYFLNKLSSHSLNPASSLMFSVSSKRNCVFIRSNSLQKDSDLSHEIDYIACVVGRKKALSTHQQQLNASLVSNQFCQIPELWIYNTITKRWRNTTLLIGIKESKAKFIKSIPAIDYQLIITEDDDLNSIQSDTNQLMIRTNDKPIAQDQRTPTKHVSPVYHAGNPHSLSRSMSVGLDHPSFYLSASASMEEREKIEEIYNKMRSNDHLINDKTMTRAPSFTLAGRQYSKDSHASNPETNQQSTEEMVYKPPLKKSINDRRSVPAGVFNNSNPISLAIPALGQVHRRRSDSDTSKSSDITDITMSTFSAANIPSTANTPFPQQSLPGGIRRPSKQILRSSIETTVNTPLTAANTYASSSQDKGVHSNNQFTSNLLQIISLAWFDNHTIVLLTLRKSIYYIEVISREILKDVYFHPTSLPAALANAMAAGATATGSGFANSYCVQSKLHKLIPLPIGFIPSYCDVMNIINSTAGEDHSKLPKRPHSASYDKTAAHQTEAIRSSSTDSAAYLRRSFQTSGVALNDSHNNPHDNSSDSGSNHYFAVIIVSDGKNFLSYQVTAKGISPLHHKPTDKSTRATDQAKMIENYSFVELWNFSSDDLQSLDGINSEMILSNKSFKTFKGYLQQYPVNGKVSLCFFCISLI
jgi:hypothetical protein